MSLNFRGRKGLTEAQVEANRARYGDNTLTPPRREPWWKLLLQQFNDPLIRILLVAAFVSLVVGYFEGHYAEAIGILAAIAIATFMAFASEYRAGKEFDSLNEVSDDIPVKVLRNGNVSTVPMRQVVVADVIIIGMGDPIPADGLLLDSVSLQVNESSLTGEPISFKSHVAAMESGSATFPPNMVYKGTSVAEGHAIVEVSAVGNATEIGKTAREATIQIDQMTPLGKQLSRLSKLIGIVGFVAAFVIFWVLLLGDLVASQLVLEPAHWLFLMAFFVPVTMLLVRTWLPWFLKLLAWVGLALRPPGLLSKPLRRALPALVLLSFASLVLVVLLGYALGINLFSSTSWLGLDITERLLLYFMVAITLIVVVVPEGLPMSVTLSLAYSMRRMMKSNNLVRKMVATETMGAATVICTDKTGTLTQNRMRVMEAHFFAEQNIAAPNPVASLIRKSLAVNNTAHLDLTKHEAVPVGNPTAAASLLYLHEHGIDYNTVRSEFDLKSQISFSSELKYMASAGYSSLSNRWLVLVKGAPDVLLERCIEILTPRGVETLDGYPTDFREELADMQRRGMRTIALAYRELHNALPEGQDLMPLVDKLVFLGFMGLADPVRPNVGEAVAQCQRAGIEVKVITGDALDTAAEICRQTGITGLHDNDNTFVSGPEFAALTDAEALGMARSLKLMYRARPSDKLRLVHLLQQLGEVVAVTGDGTNDAPALNRAHVGLAMGSGTSVAKEASDIILLDDSFTSIASAVRWGRSLYENIQRFLFFQLSINLLALAIVLLGPFVGVAIPLTVIQMLWMNLIMDTLAALALATEPPHPEVMDRKPRKPTDFILTPQLKRSILVTSLLFLAVMVVMLLRMEGTPRELTIFFNVFVMLQFWNLFNARFLGTQHSFIRGFFKNRSFLLIATLILVGQVAIVQFGGEVFRTQPLTWAEWAAIVGSTSAVLWVGEIVRFIRRVFL